MTTKPDRFRWGVIGCGLIAPRFFHSVGETGEGHVVAAASKSMRRARRFQRKTGVDRIYDSYEAMLDNERLDVVYIATTHNFHAENTRLCLDRNIPVLIEKAFTQNAKQAKEIISIARRKNVFMMEAMWTRFNPATMKVCELLAEKAIGDVRYFEAAFCVRMNPISPKMMPWNRMYSPKLAGGALLDLGIYPIAYARMVFGQPPARISSSAKMAWTGVDKTSHYNFEYSDGARAQIKSSFREMRSDEAVITGTVGRIRIPAFYRTDRFVLERYGMPDETILCGDPGFAHEIREVHRSLRSGSAESHAMTRAETLETMQTLDAIRAQWGMKYPEE